MGDRRVREEDARQGLALAHAQPARLPPRTCRLLRAPRMRRAGLRLAREPAGAPRRRREGGESDTNVGASSDLGAVSRREPRGAARVRRAGAGDVSAGTASAPAGGHGSRDRGRGAAGTKRVSVPARALVCLGPSARRPDGGPAPTQRPTYPSSTVRQRSTSSPRSASPTEPPLLPSPSPRQNRPSLNPLSLD
jgi:hypothetical protein